MAAGSAIAAGTESSAVFFELGSLSGADSVGAGAATAAGVSSAGASAALGAGTSASSFTGSAAGAGSATGSVAGVAGAAVVVAVAGSVVVTEAAAVYDFNQSWTNLWCALNLIVDSKKSLRLEGLH